MDKESNGKVGGVMLVEVVVEVVVVVVVVTWRAMVLMVVLLQGWASPNMVGLPSSMVGAMVGTMAISEIFTIVIFSMFQPKLCHNLSELFFTCNHVTSEHAISDRFMAYF